MDTRASLVVIVIEIVRVGEHGREGLGESLLSGGLLAPGVALPSHQLRPLALDQEDVEI